MVVRHTSVANKWKTVHLLLFPGHNATQVHYNITFQTSDDGHFAMAFSVSVDTREIPHANTSESAHGDEKAKEGKPTTLTPDPKVQFSDIPEDKRGPKIRKNTAEDAEVAMEVPALNISLLPVDVQYELHLLQEKLDTGDITMKGYNLTKSTLLAPFKDQPQYSVHSNGIPAAQSDLKHPKKPYKDMDTEVRDGKEDRKDEREEEEKKERVKRDERAAHHLEGGGEKEENPEKKTEEDAKVKTPQVTLVPIPIDDKPPSRLVEGHQLHTEKPPASKLLDTLVGNIVKGQISEDQPQPGAPPLGKETGSDQGAPIGRKLQHFVNSDRGFLPWERRKYFQDLLEVRLLRVSFSATLV